MRILRKLSSLITVLAVASAALSSYAVPANPKPVAMVMPDGSTITVRVCGDEHYHYYMSADGHSLLPDEAGFLRYAEIDSAGKPLCGSMRAHDVSARTAEESSYVGSLDSERIRTAVVSAGMERRRSAVAKGAGFSELITNYPSIGSPRGLIILVEFSDQAFLTPDARTEFNRLMNEKAYSHNGATGCARDYFVDNSRGMFTPQFDVYGPVTLTHNMSYYGQETGNLHDINPYGMVADACEMLDGEIDFSLYDEDGDGWVDNVFLFYAGYGQNNGAPSHTIWPHAANIFTYGGINLELDGVKIGNYACTNELQGVSGDVRTGIGTFCHEFSHVLGLPDLYATDGSSSFTPGQFELMDVGPYLNEGNTPPYMSVYDRMCLSWVNPRELAVSETVVLKSFGDADPAVDDEALLIKTITDNEYFLLENRQKSGWDKYIPGHGMLVWHIDYDSELWRKNWVNSTSHSQHLRVDIVEADGMANPLTTSGDPFPGVNNVTEFTDNSTPAMKTWTNVRVGKPITNILEQDGVISFDILGGGERIEAVTALDASDITPLGFTANWTGRSEIVLYEIDLMRSGEIVPFATYTKQTASLTDCSLAIDGLQPSTEYYYVVRAVSGDRKSANSQRVYVTTSAPTFDMYKATALEADDVCGDSFNARWEALEDADNYLLNVYTKQYYEHEVDAVDFSDGLNLPDGWYTNSNKTSGMAGTFGAARPSLCLSMDGELLQSPAYTDDVTNFGFWYKTASGTEGSLKIELQDAEGNWSLLNEIDLTASAGTVCDYQSPALEPGCHGLRLTFAKSAGSLYIDDVSVLHGAAATRAYVDGYDHRAVGNILSCKVESLTPETKYYYTVVACKENLHSIESDEIEVTTLDSSFVDEISYDGDNIRVAAADGGILISNRGDSDCDVVVADVAGRVIAAMSIPAENNALVPAAPGIYLVKAGEKTKKLTTNN